MKGLLVKDIKLLKNQKSFFVIMIAISFLFLVTDMMDTTFVVSYMTFFSVLFVVSSISYDEFNNGMAFLCTLPTTREQYVREKYVFGGIMSVIGWLISTAIATGYNIVQNIPTPINEWLLTCLCIYGGILFILFYTLPIQLKFGQNKGNIAMIVGLGTVFGIGFGVIKISESLNFDLIGKLSTTFNQLGGIGVGILFVGILIVSFIISYLISVKIMRQKQF